MSMKDFDIILIGGGFSAVIFIHHLQALKPNSRIALICKDKEIGGQAYFHALPNAVLNVPHWSMSAYVDRPDDFSRFLGINYDACLDQAFARRRDYHRYLNSFFSTQNSDQLAFLNDNKATSIEFNGSKWVITTNRGAFSAQQVVLATGNSLPAILPYEGIEQNPWDKGIIDRIINGKHILMVGSGLSAMDVAWELIVRKYSGQITFLSRRGLLPTPFELKVEPTEWNGSLGSPRSMLNYFNQSSRDKGLILGLRRKTQSIWSQWSDSEKQRFLRHLCPYWNIGRHRIAPTISRALNELIATNQVQVKAGRIKSVSIQEHEPIIEVKWQGRGETSFNTLHASSVVNCTGPGKDPLLFSMAQKKQILLDGASLGISTDAFGRVKQDYPGLYAIGPVRKGMVWENTAVPELRVEAVELAKTVVVDGKYL
jgi:uncharacterized NAD(P)/FAD-binding protein YdhS